MGDTKPKSKKPKTDKSTKVSKVEKTRQKQAITEGIKSSVGQKRVLNKKRNHGASKGTRKGH